MYPPGVQSSIDLSFGVLLARNLLFRGFLLGGRRERHSLDTPHHGACTGCTAEKGWVAHNRFQVKKDIQSKIKGPGVSMN